MSDDLDRLRGALAGRYRIDRELGRGGMAVVYLAEDLRHHRPVAVKVLSGELAAVIGADRFLREIQIAARLNHPHILPLYDSGEAGGMVYYVMPFVEGESLRDRLERERQLPVDAAVAIVRDVAAALAYAHGLGVVHRDIKPENILLSSGQAVLSDFGIARAVSAAGGDRLTATGLVLGTPAYMSPEQAAGDPKVDDRSDVYSLATVLYEMLAGRPPHSAPSFQALIAKRLTEPVPPISQLRGAVPVVLQRALEKALAREPANRFASAPEFAKALAVGGPGSDWEGAGGAGTTRRPTHRAALLRWSAVAVLAAAGAGYLAIRGRPGAGPEPGRERVTVAVLPFQTLAVPEQLHFLSVGIADAITTRLAGIGEIRVRPTTAVLRYARTGAAGFDPREAGRELATAYVLTGTVQEAEGRFRVNTQLVRVSDGLTVWGNGYDLPRADLLRLQDSVAGQVAGTLNLRLTAAERERIYRPYTDDPVAFELYLEGRTRLLRQTQAETEGAIAAFERALLRDRGYALAHAGLAMAAAQMRIRFAAEPDVATWGERARAAAHRALQLAPHLAEAHEALAAVNRYTEFDWAGTISESNRALELNPSLEFPHYYRAAAFYHLGLLDRVEPDVREGIAINPGSGSEPHRILGVTALLRGEFQRAIQELEQVQQLSARAVSDPYLAQAYYYAGQPDRAVTMLGNLSGSGQSLRRAEAVLAGIHAVAGRRAQADSLVRLVTSGSYMDHHVAYSLGAAFAQLGDATQALSWLQRSAESGFRCYPWYRDDPLLGPLRHDSPFRKFMRRLEDRWNDARREERP